MKNEIKRETLFEKLSKENEIDEQKANRDNRSKTKRKNEQKTQTKHSKESKKNRHQMILSVRVIKMLYSVNSSNIDILYRLIDRF